MDKGPRVLLISLTQVAMPILGVYLTSIMWFGSVLDFGVLKVATKVNLKIAFELASPMDMKTINPPKTILFFLTLLLYSYSGDK